MSKLEIRMPIDGKGIYLCFESCQANPKGCSYIRFECQDGNELAYWSSDEWASHPEVVMGSIMGILQNGTWGRNIILKRRKNGGE